MSIYGEFQGVHGSWEPGCNKCRVNDTDIDTIIPRMGAVVTINVGLAQARPNKPEGCCDIVSERSEDALVMARVHITA